MEPVMFELSLHTFRQRSKFQFQTNLFINETLLDRRIIVLGGKYSERKCSGVENGAKSTQRREPNNLRIFLDKINGK